MVFVERELLERYRAGDEDALETVYWTFVEYVARIGGTVLRACAAGRTHSGSEVTLDLADVVQEVFVKVFAPDVRTRFDVERPYKPYLAQITHNVAIDHWRQTRRYVPCDIARVIDDLPPDDNGCVTDRSDVATIALVNRYLESLDEESRRVYEALYVKGMSQREAAEMLGVGRQVIRTTEARLRAGLRRELSRGCRRAS